MASCHSVNFEVEEKVDGGDETFLSRVGNGSISKLTRFGGVCLGSCYDLRARRDWGRILELRENGIGGR